MASTRVETEIRVKIPRKLEDKEMLAISKSLAQSLNKKRRKGMGISFRFTSKEVYGEKWRTLRPNASSVKCEKPFGELKTVSSSPMFATTRNAKGR